LQRNTSSEEQQEYKGKNTEGRGLLKKPWKLVEYLIITKPSISV